jgi:CRISPR-associated exonuclease Cas4
MTWTTIQIGLALLLLVTAVYLWSRGLQQKTGLPDGGVIYTDTGTWYPNQNALYAQDVQLVGKPDYLIEQKDGMIVPVELKSGRAPEEPHDGHVLQLAAYCLLVEENSGRHHHRRGRTAPCSSLRPWCIAHRWQNNR